MKRGSFVVCALACGVATSVWAAEAQRIADVRMGAGQISWTPEVRAERWLLTVSGQGIYLREIYRDGEIPSVSSIAPDGLPLADGSYDWELRAIQSEPNVPVRAEEAGDEETLRIETERGTFERRIVGRPVVTSGSFVVQGGGFVAPRAEPEAEEQEE